MADQTLYEKIDTFFGGIADDVRIQKPEVFQVAQHFDVFTNPKRLTPYRAMEADETTSYDIVQFLYANSKLYGLGIVAATARAKVYEKSDPLSSAWTASSSGEDGGGSRFEKCFIHYRNYIYGGAAGTRIWAWGDLTATPSFTSTAYSTAGEPLCQGIVTTDDKLIIPCASGIAVKDGAGAGPTANWSTYAIVPASHTATDICELGDIVAIAAKPAAGYGGIVTSKVFLWDKVNADPLDIIDFGDGDLLLIDESEGELVGVSQVGGSSAFAVKARMVIRKWNGGKKAPVHFELEADDSTLTVYGNHTKVKEGNRITFGLIIKLAGTTYRQLATIGRKAAGYPLAFTLDRLVDNTTAITSIEGVAKTGQFYWVAHNDNGSVNRTDDQATNFTTAAYISQKFNGGGTVKDAERRDKQLLMAGLMLAPNSASGSASLYYRVNEESSWTLIRTYNTASGMGFEAGQADTNNDGTPDADFKNFKELQFKVETTGGWEVTAIVWAWKPVGSAIAST